MAGAGTGVPNFFACPGFRKIYWRDRKTSDLDKHRVTLTGRTRKAPGPGKGHPRKSSLSREYVCDCGHRGWSCHKDLEKLEAAAA